MRSGLINIGYMRYVDTSIREAEQTVAHWMQQAADAGTSSVSDLMGIAGQTLAMVYGASLTRLLPCCS